MNPIAGVKFANWERGFGDFHLVPDLDSLRIASWMDRTAMVLCDLHDNKTHKLVPFAPRSILRRQIDKAKDFGYTALVKLIFNSPRCSL